MSTVADVLLGTDVTAPMFPFLSITIMPTLSASFGALVMFLPEIVQLSELKLTDPEPVFPACGIRV